jgi:hypothetical protein
LQQLDHGALFVTRQLAQRALRRSWVPQSIRCTRFDKIHLDASSPMTADDRRRGRRRGAVGAAPRNRDCAAGRRLMTQNCHGKRTT